MLPVRFIAYGGAGEDLILGSQDADWFAGGSADDVIAGNSGDDVVLGDNGLDVAVLSKIITVVSGGPLPPVIPLVLPPTVDPLLSGSDLLTGGDGNDLVVGDQALPGPTGWTSVEPANGAADVIDGGAGNDSLLGGNGADVIDGGSGNDVIIGDNGTIGPQLIGTLFPLIGGGDQIDGGDGNDLILAGTGADRVSAGAGNDLVFGDFGLVTGVIDLTRLPYAAPVSGFGWTSVDVAADDGGANDVLLGGTGDDVLIGGQGADLISAGDGNDDVIGGSTVAGGADGGDLIDAGAGNDWVIGDNGSLVRTGTGISERFRTTFGGVLYDDFGVPQITWQWYADPNPANESRSVHLFDHSDTAAPGTYGNDVIAGGAQDDVIFGELGDDWIAGDSSVLDDLGNPTWDMVGTGRTVEYWAGPGTDGDDYIEGNGGDDTIFGGLGQDDIIGGSSSLFSLNDRTLRTNGRDVIYGGAGTRIDRYFDGDNSAERHARDADVILGDNGNIYRLVGPSGYLRFNYDTYSGVLAIVPRVFEFLDYTPGGAPDDLGSADLIHGEDGDDTIAGMAGNDVLFGDAGDDDVYGGGGSDRIYGGNGEDGILGDDGRILTSRNGLAEPLNRLFAPNEFERIELGDGYTGSFLAWPGRLKKQALLINWTVGGNDVIYGGLGDDFLHGGAGDDAISGAEAMAAFYNDLPVTDSNPLQYDPATGKFAAYDAANPRVKIPNFLLNFDPYLVDAAGNFILRDGQLVPLEDGLDRIFGDNGNDWLVGGTYYDWLFGGWGDDLLNLDDYLDTNNGLNDRIEDDERFRQGDFAFGGAGRDVLIANSAQDRMFDWTGDFNTYAVPFEFYDAPVVNRFYSARIAAFIRALAYAGGTDVTLTPYEPYDEPAIVPPGDPNFPDQGGPPRDPPGNVPGGPRDDFFSTNPDCVCYPPRYPVPVGPVNPDNGGGSDVCDAQCLAYTGFDLARLLEFALLLLAAGLLMVLQGRRRIRRE